MILYAILAKSAISNRLIPVLKNQQAVEPSKDCHSLLQNPVTFKVPLTELHQNLFGEERPDQRYHDD